MRKLVVITALLLFAGIAFGQSFQKGGVFGIHEWSLKLNPDVTMNQFLELWEKVYLPAAEKTQPEMTPFLLKGIGKDNKYDYVGLYYYESIEALRKYWNEDGTPTEKGAAVMEAFGPLLEEISKLGEFKYTAKDYIILL